MPAGPHPERLDLQTAGGPDRLILVGSSMRGAIYRSCDRPACYRMLPRRDAPLKLRAEAVRWIGQPRRPGLAPVVEAGQVPETDHFFVRYEIRAESSLAEALADQR